MENQKILNCLREIIPKENIKINEPMSKHTSFKTGGNADFYVTVENEEQIKKVLEFIKKHSIKFYVIGNGSNLLVKDEGFRGIIIKICKENIYIDSKEENNIIVTAGAGVKMMGFAQLLKTKGITGFEELSGIPGTIGGANKMNAGAYGKEMKDIIIETKCIDSNGKIVILKNKEQNLVYRGSIFKDNNYIILETKMHLKKGNEKNIKIKMDEYLKQRKEKQPIEYLSAGSTFKRGKGYITAKLIDECGLKGYSIGGAQISEKHAGFIINKGNATSKDILDLIEFTKSKVLEKYNIIIEEEIEVI